MAKEKRPKIGDEIVYMDPEAEKKYAATVSGFTLDNEGEPVEDYRVDLIYFDPEHEDDGGKGRQVRASGVPHEEETGMEETRCWRYPEKKKAGG